MTLSPFQRLEHIFHRVELTFHAVEPTFLPLERRTYRQKTSKHISNNDVKKAGRCVVARQLFIRYE